MENQSSAVINLDDNIRLVGTAHISRLSADLVKEQIADFKPDIVAVELDKDRLQALQNPQASSIEINDLLHRQFDALSQLLHQSNNISFQDL